VTSPIEELHHGVCGPVASRGYGQAEALALGLGLGLGLDWMGFNTSRWGGGRGRDWVVETQGKGGQRFGFLSVEP
jgi:hypothetical protein